MKEDTRIFCRIKKITFFNFRNIEYGEVEFPNSRLEDFQEESPSILGLYGQNGSGKTSLIMALGILKRALSGRAITRQYASAVKEGCDSCKLGFEFSLYDEEGFQYQVGYSFELKTEKQELSPEEPKSKGRYLFRLFNEVLRYQRRQDSRILDTDQILIDTTPGASKKGMAFGNDNKYRLLINGRKDIHQRLHEIKAVAYEKQTSFIFSRQLAELFYKRVINPKNDYYLDIIASLSMFGNRYLYVIDTFDTGLTNMKKYLPLSIWYDVERGPVQFTNIILDIDNITRIEDTIYPSVVITASFCSSFNASKQLFIFITSFKLYIKYF